MTYEGLPPEGQENRFRWRDAEGGLTLPSWLAIGVAIAVVVLGFGAWWTFILGRGGPMEVADHGIGEMADAPQIPAVHGFYAGEAILFIHTEASDQQVADMLTGMMGSPVLVVPALADVPQSALGTPPPLETRSPTTLGCSASASAPRTSSSTTWSASWSRRDRSEHGGD